MFKLLFFYYIYWSISLALLAGKCIWTLTKWIDRQDVVDWKAAKKNQSNQVPVSCLPIRTPVLHWYASLPWIIITEEKLCDLRSGPLENLWGGGGEGRAKYNKILAQGKIKWKKLCMPINPKKYSCYGLKKIRTRNLITKKNSCGSKIPHPPTPP